MPRNPPKLRITKLWKLAQNIRLDQNHPRRLHEQNPQVAVTSRRYLTEDGAVAGRDLLGNEAQPGGEVAPLGEHVACANRRYHPARDDLPATGPSLRHEKPKRRSFSSR
jgi:hypothetical protein